MGKTMGIIFGAVCISLCRMVTGTMWYVSGSVSASGDGLSWETAFKKIQDGIDAASDGDTVTVARGTYLENIRFNAKNIVLTSTNPLDPDVVATTIIDGNQAGSVVTFAGTERELCTLSGFTIRNGARYMGQGGGICGGPADDETRRTEATIRNNVISGNSAKWQSSYGGGIAWCNGAIEENVIENNYALYSGGGLFECNGTIRNNTITANRASERGGGLYGCNGLIENNTVRSNQSNGGCAGLGQCDGTIQGNEIVENYAKESGGGLGLCDGLVRGNIVARNSAGSEGGGLSSCRGRIENNRITNNTAGSDGGGLYDCLGTVRNNVICGNYAARFGGGLFQSWNTVENNLICANVAGEGGGGLAKCNYIVQNNTICGNRANLDGGGLGRCLCAIRNCIIWGNVAGRSGSQIYDSNTPSFSCIQGWKGGGEGNIAPSYPLFVNPNGPDKKSETYEDNDYRLQATSPCRDAGVNYYWFVWPQRDLDGNCRLSGPRVDMGCYEHGSSADSDGDLLPDESESSAGTDPLLSDTDGDGLRDGVEVLRGTSPLEVTPPRIVHVPEDIPTIQQSLCLAVTGDEIIVGPGTYRENVVFCGADVALRSSDPEDARVVSATVLDGGKLGAVVSFNGTGSPACILSGFTITRGFGPSGAGINGSLPDATCYATIGRNLIAGNSSAVDWNAGGGISYCSGTIEKNVVTGNSAYQGGGLARCYGTVQGNVVCGNTAAYGGGGLYGCGGVVQNNIVYNNSAPKGGGLYSCGGTVQNNTIYRNSAGDGGGLHDCKGTSRNCIVWANAGYHGPQLYGCSVPSYSCIQGWAEGGEGNITDDPGLADPDGPDGNLATYLDNNFRLLADSPCIDMGDNSVLTPPGLDLDGNLRIAFGRESLRVDMGAYECNSPAFAIKRIEPAEGGRHLLIWNSQPNDSYSIRSCPELLRGSWNNEATVPSQGESTTWTDPDTTSPGKFYRIEMK